MKPITFKNVARVKFNAILAKIEAQAATSVVGDMGSADGHGFAAAWIYSEPEQTLAVTITKAPFGMEGLAADKLAQLVEAA